MYGFEETVAGVFWVFWDEVSSTGFVNKRPHTSVIVELVTEEMEIENEFDTGTLPLPLSNLETCPH